MAIRIFCLGLASVVAVASAAPPRLAVDAEIREMVRKIDPDRIESHVRALVGFGTRNTMSDTRSDTRGIGAARRWIHRTFETISAESGGQLKVAFDGYMQAPDGRRIVKPVKIVNVVATLPGSQPGSAERIYIVSGHYDSITSDPTDFKADAPGANDDASGVAAVLEIARVMSAYTFDATVVFMAVAGEEQGLFGSKHAAAKARSEGWDVAGMFTNDIIGGARLLDGTGDRRRVRVFSEGVPINESEVGAQIRSRAGGENDAPARQLARYVSRACDAYVENFDVMLIFRLDRLMRGGDHKPFSLAGYSAIRFTEVYENYHHQHKYVREVDGVQQGDLPEFVDFGYVADVARVNLAALASLARAPARPRNVRIVTAQLTNDTVLRWDANGDSDLGGYEVVRRETTAAEWQESKRVGAVTECRLSVSKDNYFFGVAAVDKGGHRSDVVFPVPAKK